MLHRTYLRCLVTFYESLITENFNKLYSKNTTIKENKKLKKQRDKIDKKLRRTNRKLDRAERKYYKRLLAL